MAQFTPQMLRDLLASPDPKDQELAQQLSALEFSNENGRLANYPPPPAAPDQSALNSKYIQGSIGNNGSGGMAAQDMPFPAPPQAAPAPQPPAPPPELVPNQFRNERTGKVTTLSPPPTVGGALPGVGGTPGKVSEYPGYQQPTPQSDVAAGIQVLQSVQRADGKLWQIVKAPMIGPDGRQTLQTQFREVTPSAIDPLTKAGLGMQQAQATLAHTQAQTAKLSEPTHYQPSVKDILDPTDNSRMIAVDMNKYRGGGLNSPGVMGVSGKEPTHAKRQEGVQAGLDSFNSIVSGLRSSYGTLKNAGDISSSDKTAPENILNAVQSSGVGQLAGRIVGTKSQDERNVINSARNILLQSIMQATGMTSRQIDSNVELKAWMAAVTDPSRSYESNMKVLDNLENFVATKAAAVTNPTTNTAAPAQAAQSREVSLQDILAAAKKTGKDPLQVRKDAMAKGYVVKGM